MRVVDIANGMLADSLRPTISRNPTNLTCRSVLHMPVRLLVQRSYPFDGAGVAPTVGAHGKFGRGPDVVIIGDRAN